MVPLLVEASGHRQNSLVDGSSICPPVLWKTEHVLNPTPHRRASGGLAPLTMLGDATRWGTGAPVQWLSHAHLGTAPLPSLAQGVDKNTILRQYRMTKLTRAHRYT